MNAAERAKHKSRKAVASWAAVAVWAVFIFFASAHTGLNLEEGSDFLGQLKNAVDALLAQLAVPGLQESSSLGHFCEYTVLGVLLANALRFRLPLLQACLLAVLCASAYGVTDEFHQLFVPGRACDAADWAVDTVGASLGAAVFGGLRRAARERMR